MLGAAEVNAIDSGGWFEHQGDYGLMQLDMLSLPSPALELVWKDGDLLGAFVLPAAAAVESTVQERSISITARKKRRRRATPPVSPSPSENSESSIRSTGSAQSIGDGLDACTGVLKRIKAGKWCNQHCSENLQLCDEHKAQPGVGIWVFQ